jgi:hypothetical protein
VLGIGTLSGLALTPATAEAHAPVAYRHRRFEVLYFHCGHWVNYGCYGCWEDANRAAHHLRHEGHRVRIDRA